MHGHASLSAVPAVADQAGARHRRAAFKSTVVGALLQILAALLIHLVPPFQAGNLYPVLATLASAITGFLFARAARGLSLGRHLRGGALAAGSSGILGTTLFAVLGHLSFQIVPIAVITCAVAGAVGAPLGRARRGRPNP